MLFGVNRWLQLVLENATLDTVYHDPVLNEVDKEWSNAIPEQDKQELARR